MRPRIILTIFVFAIIGQKYFAQQFGHFASATYIKTCNSEKFYNIQVDRADPDCINPECDTIFDAKNFGAFFKNSNDLILKGGELKTFRGTNSNVCGAKLYYLIYTVGNRPINPVFSQINLPHVSNCDIGISTFQDSYGPCIDRDQKWGNQAQDINLTQFDEGEYALEVYFETFGSHNSTNQCNDTVRITNSNANFISLFQIVEVSISADGPTTFCQGEDVTLTSSQVGANTWNTGETTNSINVNATGTYSVLIPTLNACQTTNQASIAVSVNALPTVSAGVDQIICEGSNITLSGSGADSYQWSAGVINNTAFIPTQDLIYTVTGTNISTNCTNTASVSVTIIALPSAEFIVNPTNTYINTPIVITNNSTNASTFQWDFHNNTPILNTNNTDNQIINYEKPGDYYIVLTSSNGVCSEQDSILVQINNLDSIFVDVPLPTTPNIFTPDGDGQNEFFYLKADGAIDIQVIIMNRWGEVIHEMKDLNATWDGKINGQNANEGTYFYKYTVTYKNNKHYEGQNFLTLIR